ncbi:MAG: NPCBM/NEW2 domain-containing protein, partial [Bacillota bacterium]
NEKFVMAGDAALRAASPIRKVPKYAMAPQDVDVLLLSDLQEIDGEGNFARMNRDLNYRGRALTLGGVAYPTGLGAQLVREAPSFVEFNIAPGPWRRLRGVIGIEVKANCSALEKERTSVTFIVRGDGKELFRSAAFRVDSGPKEIDVDVTGVRRLRLELTGEGRFNAATSCDWCGARLERQ